MKKVVILAGLLANHWFNILNANGYNSTPIKPVRNSDLQFLYSHYMQDGNNSAVTGGIGTEKLTVYSSAIVLKTQKLKNSWQLKFGSDVISSASTDNIDFVKSSASILDARTHANLNYSLSTRKFGNFSLGTGFSMESDYFSKSFNLGYQSKWFHNKTQIGISGIVYLDDLRWGRLNPTYKKPVRLIYPSELRNINWFDVYNRNSYNVKATVQYNVNHRNRIGFYPEFTLQNGLLSTPFHRVYFADGSLKVEKFPNQRIKSALGLKWNSFLKEKTVFKCAVDLFKDNFGVNAIGTELELAIKFNDKFTVSPFTRLYTQSQSDYFKPYKEHQSNEEFYTSDRDLSRFNSIKLGTEFKYFPSNKKGKASYVNGLIIRYAYYSRDNGLSAHIVSLEITIKNKYRKK
ncbi:MAG TPA: DUF3570 domain-containing protein [Bacteroidia bacterium]